MSISLPMAPRRVERTTRKSLAVPLTDEELKAKTDQMIAHMTELADIEVEHKERKKEMSEETKELKSDISKARKIIVARSETRLVEDAKEIFDIETKKTWFEYRDTRYDERAMSEMELRTHTKPPLFPNHEEDVPGAVAEGGLEDELDDLKVEPLPDNVEEFGAKTTRSDIADVMRDDQRRVGRKDHTV